MREFNVGGKYPDMIYPEGVRFQIDASGSYLLINYDGVKKDEVDAVQSGDLEYKLFYYRDVLWLLFRFGSQPWIETPYTFHLSPEGTDLPEIPEGEGLGCLILLIENRTGELKAMRFISFESRYTRAIKESIENQRDKPFNLVTYDQTLHETMAAYTTKQMVKAARVGGRIRR